MTHNTPQHHTSPTPSAGSTIGFTTHPTTTQATTHPATTGQARQADALSHRFPRFFHSERHSTSPSTRTPHGVRRRPYRILAATTTALSVFALAACGSGDSDKSATGAAPAGSLAGTTVVVGQTNVLASLDPIKDSWSLTAMGISEYGYMQDKDGNLYSRFFSEVNQKDALDWTLSVKNGVKFSDGSDVTAQAIADSFNDIQAKNSYATTSAGLMTFTAVDNSVITVHTERETHVMKSILGEWNNVVYKKTDDGSYVFTGPYVPTKLDPKNQLELVPNKYYDDRAHLRPNVTVKAFSDPDAMRLALQSKSIDMAFTVTPSVADKLKNDPDVYESTIDAGYQYMARFNLKSGPATEKAVRTALDQGLNRNDYVKALGGGRPATGFFAHYYPFAGTEDVTSDPAAAKATLDAAGWQAGSDGIRTKDGQRLSLHIITYPTRPDLAIIQQIMVSQLKELGIEVQTSVVDDITAAVADGDYDLALWAQHTAPTGEPGFFLNQFFRTDGANNTTGYSSATVDNMLDQLGTLTSDTERNQLAQRIQHQIHKDEPALMLVDPQWHMATSSKLANYQPYCGDYYVINPELGLS